MTFAIFWVGCGILAADAQCRWHKRHDYRNDDVVLIWWSSIMLGPIGLVATWAAYGL